LYVSYESSSCSASVRAAPLHSATTSGLNLDLPHHSPDRSLVCARHADPYAEDSTSQASNCQLPPLFRQSPEAGRAAKSCSCCPFAIHRPHLHVERDINGLREPMMFQAKPSIGRTTKDTAGLPNGCSRIRKNDTVAVGPVVRLSAAELMETSTVSEVPASVSHLS